MQFLDSGATCNTSLVGKRTFFLRLKKTQESSSFLNVVCDSVVLRVEDDGKGLFTY